MFGARKWLRSALTLLALGCAGGVGAIDAGPTAGGWKADPEEQFLLDVNIRQLRLGQGVRAYQTPEGTCVLLGDLLTALDVPMNIELAQKKAGGWAFRESHRISIDVAAGKATYGDKSEAIGPETVRETPEGWCVDSAALSRWFAIGIKPLTAASVLMLESEAKLPVELAIERKERATRLKPAKFDLSTLPQVRLPYRMWRAPALDFVVSAGVTYRARDGARVDRRATVFAAGEVARLSYDAQMSTDQGGLPQSVRLRAYRSDPDAGLLGPLKATHVGFGDVEGFRGRLSGASNSGRGAVITNRPLFNPTDFDRTRFEGDMPTGWEAEIYRNGQLVAFANATPDQRYVFDDVDLQYGENRFSIILYGPQGQVRTRDEVINVGQDNVPAGVTWYWAGVNQPGRDLLSLRRSEVDSVLPKAQAAVSVEHGIDTQTSVGALAQMMLVEDERLTFLEGSVRRSIGSALIEVSASRDSGGGSAARAQMLGKFGTVNVSAEATLAKDFHLDGARETSLKDFRLSADAPLRLGRTVIPANASARLTERADGSRQLEAAARLSANLQRFNLATDVRYRRNYMASGPAPPGELDVGLLGTGRVGDVRLRGATRFDLAPETRFRSAELSAYWSASEKVAWEAGVAFESDTKRARGRISHVRKMDMMALAVTAEAATDGSLAFGVNANFSLDASNGIRFSRLPLAGAGMVQARVYRDLNDNGLRDPAEPLEEGALVTTGTRLSNAKTDDTGRVTIGGLAAFSPVTVGIDQSSLADPMFVPRKALQVVVPRPGVPAQVEIGLVGAGEVEGVVVKSGGLGFEGLDLELVDAAGTVVATARSDYDGFFLFERVPYGSYRLQISSASAEAAGLAESLSVAVEVSVEKPIARLGTLEPSKLQRIASAL